MYDRYKAAIILLEECDIVCRGLSKEQPTDRPEMIIKPSLPPVVSYQTPSIKNTNVSFDALSRRVVPPLQLPKPEEPLRTRSGSILRKIQAHEIALPDESDSETTSSEASYE
jgi:hypothetical protein